MGFPRSPFIPLLALGCVFLLPADTAIAQSTVEGTVTLRERDSMEQTRIPIADLTIHLMKLIH